MNTLDAIQARLLAQGVSTETGNAAGNAAWPCFRGFMPDSPDQCITVQYTGGFPQDTLGGENMLPTFQVRIRAGELAHGTCEAKWIAAFNALQDSQGATGMTDFALVRAMSTAPIYMVDDRNRPIMILNFAAVRNRQ
jgi:hypothetical protein